MIRFAVAAVLVVAAAQALARTTAPAPAPQYEPDYEPWPDLFDNSSDPYDEPDQLPDAIESIWINMNPATFLPPSVPPDLAQANLRATLDAIAWAEGTDGPEGYRTMFGYRYFDSFDDHPRQYFPFTDQAGRKLFSSASGRYQIIVKTWDTLRERLGLQDFSPASQDAAAVELIRERGALGDAYAGRIQAVADKCRAVWASLPGSNVDQPTRTMAGIVAAYQAAGGALA